MSRESPYYRDVLKDLLEIFGGAQCINAGQYASYLGMPVQSVGHLIDKGALPGKHINRTYIIPVRSIAIFEATTARAKEY